MQCGKILIMIQKDLIVVGDWMAPKIFKNNGRRLADFKSNLTEYPGFWNAVSCVDLNGDGKRIWFWVTKEQILPTSAANPFKLFVNDFDRNGTIEQIVTRSINGRDMPLNLKQDVAKQIDD
jgi:hypothetical protein